MTSTPVAVGQQAKSGLLRRYLPIVGWLPAYHREWFAPDAVAALSVWALLVPRALGYATIAGVPVQCGLYASHGDEAVAQTDVAVLRPNHRPSKVTG